MNSAQLRYLVGACLLTVLTVVGCATPESSMGSLDPNAAQVESDVPTDMTFKLTDKDHPGLLDPSKAKFTAPDIFKAKFKTTKGDFVVEVKREWAPNGADRFYSMVKVGYYKNTGIFRAIDNFMFQFGIHGVPEVAAKWTKANIKDDPKNGKSNIRGTLSFAQTGMPNSRSSQMFVNLGDNTSLDNPRQGSPFVPFGRVVKGMDVVSKISTFGENSREVQGRFTAEGNAFIQKKYPALDYILSVSIVDDKEAEATKGTGETKDNEASKADGESK